MTNLLERQVLVNLDFSPNTEQQHLIKLLVEFSTKPNADELFLLQGYAGTGKTSILGAFVQSLTQSQIKTVLLAPTGRAAKVLAAHAHHSAFTIHKKIYRQKRYTGEIGGFELNDNLHKNTLFIIDEASMISDQQEQLQWGTGSMLEDLIEYVYAGENCKLLLLGDHAQLPPVGQTHSPAMSEQNLRRFGLDVVYAQLTQPARQGSLSGILFNATALRQVMAQGEPYDLPQFHLKNYPDIKAVMGNELIEEIANSYQRAGIEETIIITRSNKRANQFNQGIRFQILYREDELSSGDLLLIAKNNYFWCKDLKNLDFMANGDIVEVKRVRRSYEMYGLRFVDAEVVLPDYEVEVEVRILLDTLHSDAASLTAEQQQQLFQSVSEDYEHITNERSRMLALKSDPFFNALQVKYAFAMTCHKSQGGQWEEVYIDMGMINKDHLGLDFYRWLYTAITRATKHVYLVNIQDEFIADQ